MNSFYLRDDDKEEVIRKRLTVFKKNTLPVLNHYQKCTKVISINGIGEIEEVNQSIMKLLTD